MKRLLTVLFTTLSMHCSFGQELSPYYKMKAADRVKQVLKDFESAFSLLTNPYISDKEERDEATYRLRATLRDDARFENDLIPGNKGSRTIDFNEYQRIAFIGYKKSGLIWNFEWESAEFRAAPGGYLVFFYGVKSVFGRYQERTSLRMENVPCRAGVFLRMNGNEAAEIKIGFMDTNLKEKGKSTISLTEQRNPLDFITLPEVIDKLGGQIVKALSGNAARHVVVEEITYHKLGISNDFSKQLTGTLKSTLMRLDSNIQVVQTATRSLESPVRLRGGYQKAGNFLRIGVQLFDIQDKPASAPLFAEILLLNIPNAEIEPAEHLIREAERIQEITSADTGKDGPAQASGLVLELTTDKGYGPQLYRESEIMTLKVRANKPCTVRMIYQDAAKNMVRLRNDDFAIKNADVGKWIEIPEKFECAAPFGLELLLAYATEGKFKPILKTKSQNGFTFILDDLKNVVDMTADGHEKIAKCAIPITTRAKRKTI